MSIIIYTFKQEQRMRALMICWCLLMAGGSFLSAQDIHYTQFYNAPFQVSPSQIGLFEGHVRVQGNYRNQWRTVPVGYKTLTLAVDKKFYSRNKYQFFSGGLVLNYDQAGFSELNHNQVNLLGSFTRRTSKKTYVTLGGIIGFNQRAFNLNNLTFDNQYNGVGGVDQTVDSGENFGGFSNNFADYSVGIS